MLDGIDDDTLNVMADMMAQQLVADMPPSKLRLYLMALDALRLDDSNPKKSYSTLLEFIAGLMVTSELPREAFAEMFVVWSLHFKDTLPEYAYENQAEVNEVLDK